MDHGDILPIALNEDGRFEIVDVNDIDERRVQRVVNEAIRRIREQPQNGALIRFNAHVVRVRNNAAVPRQPFFLFQNPRAPAQNRNDEDDRQWEHCSDSSSDREDVEDTDFDAHGHLKEEYRTFGQMARDMHDEMERERAKNAVSGSHYIKAPDIRAEVQKVARREREQQEEEALNPAFNLMPPLLPPVDPPFGRRSSDLFLKKSSAARLRALSEWFLKREMFPNGKLIHTLNANLTMAETLVRTSHDILEYTRRFVSRYKKFIADERKRGTSFDYNPSLAERKRMGYRTFTQNFFVSSVDEHCVENGDDDDDEDYMEVEYEEGQAPPQSRNPIINIRVQDLPEQPINPDGGLNAIFFPRNMRHINGDSNEANDETSPNVVNDEHGREDNAEEQIPDTPASPDPEPNNPPEAQVEAPEERYEPPSKNLRKRNAQSIGNSSTEPGRPPQRRRRFAPATSNVQANLMAAEREYKEAYLELNNGTIRKAAARTKCRNAGLKLSKAREKAEKWLIKKLDPRNNAR